MCEPATMIMAASTAVGIGSQAYSGYTQYQAAKSNAKEMKRQGALAEKKAELDAANAERNALRTMGKRDARVGKSGGDVSSFSDVFADDSSEAALEQEIIIFNGKTLFF